MSPEQWAKVDELFHAASALPPSERDEVLRRETGGDEVVRLEVLSLLGADKGGDSVLAAEISRAAAGVVVTAEATSGERIGPYSVRRPLGRGGMGVVFLADRDDDAFRKQVAIKLVKAGFANDESLRRFRSERQILARLEHPNIARLLDGGSTPSGQPYVVMEYVDGQPLLEYCRASNLGIRPRLELFRLICGAVQYAHQNLIVHRDIKPANVLVSRDGVPKLVDFGIAKLLDDDPFSTAPTRSLDRVLTPEYASPEQVRGEAVSTATDVYSLGALLYELLTGRAPFSFPSRSAAEVERVVSTEDPPPPGVDRDLDNIILLAMRKDPTRRYESAAALSEDVDRHLHGYPVKARQEGWTYRAGKFVSRNKATVGAGAVFAMLLAGFVITVVQERNKATVERTKAQEISRFLTSVFTSADPSETSGNKLSARQLLDQGVQRLDSELRGQPTAQLTLLATMAESYFNIGELKEGLRVVESAVQLAARTAGKESVEMADLLATKGYLLRENGDYPGSEASLNESLAILGRIAPGDLDRRASYLRSLGPLLNLQRRNDEAESVLREALTLRRKVSGNNHPEVGWNLANLSRVLVDRGEHKAALPLAQEALQLQRQRYGEMHSAVASAHNRLAVVQYFLRDMDHAADNFRKAVDIGRKLHGENHREVASNLSGLATILNAKGDYAEAVKAHREAVGILRKSYNGKHPVLANFMTNLSMSLHNNGDHDEEARLVEEMLDIHKQTGGEKSDRYISARVQFARTLIDREEYEKAIPVLQENAARRRTAYPHGHDLRISSATALGGALLAMGRCKEAVPDIVSQLPPQSMNPEGGKRSLVAEAKTVLADCEAQLGNHLDAARHAREAFALLDESRDMERVRHRVNVAMASVLLRSGQPEQAEPLLRVAYQRRQTRTYNAVEKGIAAAVYARCLQALGRVEEAGRLRQEARALLRPYVRLPLVRAAIQ
ncbi:MAG: serine/threonine protein kinase [Acidobacteria bacterium]|nr:serine/threonine protein kinase [Acidobacteriota bacterium]